MEKIELNKIKEFLKDLVSLLGSVLLYSINRSRTEEILFKPYDKLLDILRVNNKFTIGIFEGEIVAEEKGLGLPAGINRKLASLLKALKIHNITFKDGVTKEEWRKFIEALTAKSEKIDTAGGINNLFKNLNLKNISVNETSLIKAPKEATEGKKETASPIEKKEEKASPTKKVLIVEDDEEERELFRDVVKK